MYLGSRPAASVARWSTRPDLSVPGMGLPDYNAGWPIHHGQSNKVKYHHHYATVSSPFVGGDEYPSPFLCASRSLPELQNWPKSEFELVAEEEEGDSLLKNVVEETDSICSHAPCPSEWSLLDESVHFGCASLSKTGSVGETETTIGRVKSDGMSVGGDDINGSSPGQETTPTASLKERPDFPDTELFYNRHAHEMRLALPEGSSRSDRPSAKQTDVMTVCRPSACRRRVHPVAKFTNEFVNWMPQTGGTDDEKGEDDDNHDVEFGHCITAKTPKCNGSHIVPVNLKRSYKRPCSLSKLHHHHHHHPKRKRSQFSVEGKDGGIYRRRKQHNPWSIEETRMLIKGVSICGEGHWADIKRLEFTELASRSPVDLKDKWRNLLRLAQFSHTYPRNKKVRGKCVRSAEMRVMWMQGEKRTDLPAELLQQVRKLGSHSK